jgi:hypothetical protein
MLLVAIGSCLIGALGSLAVVLVIMQQKPQLADAKSVPPAPKQAPAPVAAPSAPPKRNVQVSAELFVNLESGDVKRAAGLGVRLTPITGALRDLVSANALAVDKLDKERDTAHEAIEKQYPTPIGDRSDNLSKRINARNEYDEKEYMPRVLLLVAPVEAALRKVAAYQTTTDSEGKFRLEVKEGKYLLTSDPARFGEHLCAWCQAVELPREANLSLNQSAAVTEWPFLSSSSTASERVFAATQMFLKLIKRAGEELQRLLPRLPAI